MEIKKVVRTLVCDSVDAFYLTVGKKYESKAEDSHFYKIIDDNKTLVWLPKELFHEYCEEEEQEAKPEDGSLQDFVNKIEQGLITDFMAIGLSPKGEGMLISSLPVEVARGVLVDILNQMGGAPEEPNVFPKYEQHGSASGRIEVKGDEPNA